MSDGVLLSRIQKRTQMHTEKLNEKMVYLIKKVKPRYRNKMCAGNNSSNRESNKDTGTDKINYKN